MEMRVTRLEAAVERMEPLLVRIDERINHLGTKEDLANIRADIGKGAGETRTLAEAINGLGNRLTLVEGGLSGLGSKVDGKMISGGGMFTIFAGLMALFVTLGGIGIAVLKSSGMLN
jgi:hypothetical protein